MKKGGDNMILWEGREAYYNGNKVVILEKVNSKLVKVCKKSNPKMIFFVRKDELGVVWVEKLVDWMVRHL